MIQNICPVPEQESMILLAEVKGEENRLQYTLEYHDDGEGFTIHTEKDDIWERMSTQELERLDVKLGQEVLYYHYHNKTVNADT